MASIMVVDDDPQFRMLLRKMLIGEAHSVVTAENGAEAVDAYRAQPVDLVITDILMPEQDGIDTILALRRQTPAPAVIAMSGGRRMVSADFNLESAALLGVAATLRKPFERAELAQAVAKALAAR